MAQFKKFDNQQTYQLDCYVDGDAAVELAVGALFARSTETGEITVISDLGDLEGANEAGTEIYMVAQSDAVTHKTGTAYKTYIVGNRKVVVSNSSAAKSLVVAYRVENIDNIEL